MHSSTNLFAVTDADFEAIVLKADRPVIVDFWAEWCPPCRAIAPLYERLSAEYAGKIGFAEMDTDPQKPESRLQQTTSASAAPPQSRAAVHLSLSRLDHDEA